MSQTLDLIVSAKNSTDAAFKQLQSGLGGTEAQLKKLVPATDAWSEAKQRATQRMERMHDEALKMNTGLVATSDKSELLGRNLNALQGAVTTTASAFGVSASSLGPLNAAVDVASIGMDKLKTSTVGFNTATIGVAGAALAIGAAIGTWLRTFPAVTKVADDLARGLILTRQELDALANAESMGSLSKQQKEWAKSAEEATVKQITYFRSLGMTVKEIEAQMKGDRQTTSEAALAAWATEDAAAEKAAAAAKKRSEALIEQAKKMAASISGATVTWTGFFMQMPAAIKPADAAMIDLNATFEDSDDYIVDFVEGTEKAIEAIDKLPTAAEKADAALAEMWEGVADDADQMSSILDSVDGMLDQMGVSAESSTRRVIQGFSQAAKGVADFAAGMASANPAQMISGVVGVIGSLVGFLSAGSKARAEAMRLANEIRLMRNEFIASRGGIEILRLEAERAGVSLNAMLNARTVQDYERAVEELQRQLDLFEKGTKQTLDALERWKIPIQATSEAFQNARFHEGMAEFYRDLELLAAAGVDFTEIMASEMGPALTEFVQNALDSGRALPEFMRPWIQKMIEAGLLLDENGNKITDISQLEFTETLEAGVARLILEIRELVRVMQGIPREINTNIHVTETLHPGGGGGHHVPPNDDPPGQAEGGWFPYRPGGHRVRVAEETGEAIIPDDKMAGFIAQALAMAGGSGATGHPAPPSVHVYIGANGVMRELRDVIVRYGEAGQLVGRL